MDANYDVTPIFIIGDYTTNLYCIFIVNGGFQFIVYHTPVAKKAPKVSGERVFLWPGLWQSISISKGF
jgi:hypothetical protein